MTNIYHVQQKADYALLVRFKDGTPIYFTEVGRETVPRKKVDRDSITRVQKVFDCGGYDAIAYISDGKNIGLLPEPLIPSDRDVQPVVAQAADQAELKGEQPPMSALITPDTPPADAVSNAQFAKDMFGTLPHGQFCWATSFSAPPKEAGGAWKGHKILPEDIQDTLFGNAYISAAALKFGADKTVKKDNAHFAAMHLVILDDTTNTAITPTYKLETSPGNFQLGFKLAEPITDIGIAERLLQEIAKADLGNDKSGNLAVRYVRLPVGCNTKTQPHFQCKLHAYNPELTYTLEQLIAAFELDGNYILNGGKPANQNAQANGDETSTDATYHAHDQPDADQIKDLISAVDFLDSDPRDDWIAMTMALRTAKCGYEIWLEKSKKSSKSYPVKDQHTWDTAKPNKTHWKQIFVMARAKGWKGRVKEASDEQPATYAPLVDPFRESTVPPFPTECLPEALNTFCKEYSYQSGFDVGGYGFAFLIAASNMIDHQLKLSVGPMSIPAFLWGMEVGPAGTGKSPMIGAATKFIKAINEKLMHQSRKDYAKYQFETQGLSPEARAAVKRPPWRQLIASDTTVEGLGKLLNENPSGVLMHFEEISEWLGRMDSYKSAGGADRAVYLRSFDGGSVTINRAGMPVPQLIENFSVGLLGGIQDEKLTELYKKSAGGSDGLLQRALLYKLPRAGRLDYKAKLSPLTDFNAALIFETLHKWNTEGVVKSVSVSPEASALMEDYHTEIRKITARLSSGRFSEHLDKFPGFLARVTFTLHCCECAAAGDDETNFRSIVSLETVQRAKQIMGVLYRHSSAVYESIDQSSGVPVKLLRSACEAILTKGWQSFQRAQLTQYATHWQSADPRDAEGAIDLLIELGWVCDITPPIQAGKRGRRSMGLFQVNPEAHIKFDGYSNRIAQERAERFTAIQKIASKRPTGEDLIS